jgi:predicted ATPase
VALHGLDRGGVAALLSGPLGRERAEGAAEEVQRRTGGNPFLVVQLGRLLASDPAALASGGLPAGARDLLAGRLATLAPGDRAVLVAAAVLGSAFTTAELSAVLELPVADVAGALDRAATARVVERTAGVVSWSFVHDLFREATLEPLGDQERRALHERAAAVLAAGDAEPAVVAHHLLAAASGRSTEASRWSVRAGERVGGGGGTLRTRARRARRHGPR